MTDDERGAAATATASDPEAKDTEKDSDKDVDERTRVLRMVAEGRITVDEAVELLKALAPEPEPEQVGPEPRGPWGSPFGPGRPGPGPFGAFGPGFRAQWKQGFGPQPHEVTPGVQWPPGWRPGAGWRPGRRGRRGRPGQPGQPGGQGETDVVWSAAVAPPVPPVPPVPGVGPVPPVPPVPPFFGSANRVLVFEVHFEGNRYNARLPIGLVSDVNRYLPRPVRTALEAVEVDIAQLIEILNNMDDEHGATLIDLEHEGNRVKVRVEVTGQPDLA